MKRTNRVGAVECIRNREEFVASSLSGARGWATGLLGPRLRLRFLKDAPVYVVYSYATPIAWLPAHGPGRWIAPRHRYSVTTSAHQTIVAAAVDPQWLNDDGEEVEGRWGR